MLGPHEQLIYLFNPFTGATLERALDAIAAAGQAHVRWIAYVNPTEHDAFDRRFALHAHFHVEPGHVEVALYRSR